MNKHNPNQTPHLSLVLHTSPPAVQVPRSDLEARQYVAALAAVGFARTPAPLVAREPLDRSLRTVYGWGEPGMVGGLRAHDLILCPRPFARVVLRGMVAAVDGAPPPDGPSRSSLAALLARIASLLIVTASESPAGLDDKALQERLKTFDDIEDATRRERAPYDREALRRQLAARPAPPSLAEGEKGGA